MNTPMSSQPTTGRVPRAYAWTVIRLRWPILAGWAAAAAYAAFVLPAPVQPPDSLASLVPAAARVDRRASARPGSGPVAVPVINVRGVVPGSRETGTTAITYLAYPAATPIARMVDGANRVRGRGGHVTGILPAEVHEGGLV